MKWSIARTLGAELLIGAAVCLGGYAGMIEPMEREAAKLRGEIDGLNAMDRAAQVSAPEPSVSRARIDRATARAEIVRGLSSSAKDETVLMNALSSLASARGVRIEQLSTSPARTVSGGGASLAAGLLSTPSPPPTSITNPGHPGAASTESAGATGHGGDRASGCMMTVTGTYSAMISFVHAIETELGYSRVRMLRLTPLGGPGETGLTAQVRTEHYIVGAIAATSGETGR